MILLVTYEDEDEEEFEVAPQTRVGTLLKDGYWRIRTADGRQVAVSADRVDRVETVRAPRSLPDDESSRTRIESRRRQT